MGDESMDWERPTFDEMRERNTRVRKHNNKRARGISMRAFVFFACMLSNIPWFILVFAPWDWTTKLILAILIVPFQVLIITPFLGKKLQENIKEVDDTYRPY